jgi:hypothetical protein
MRMAHDEAAAAAMTSATTVAHVLERLLSVTPEYTLEDMQEIMPELFSTSTLAELAEKERARRSRLAATPVTPQHDIGSPLDQQGKHKRKRRAAAESARKGLRETSVRGAGFPFDIQAAKATETMLATSLQEEKTGLVRHTLLSPTSLHVVEHAFWVVHVLLFEPRAVAGKHLPLLLSRMARRVNQVQDVLASSGGAAAPMQLYVVCVAEAVVVAFRNEFPSDGSDLRRPIHECIGTIFFEAWDEAAVSRLLAGLFGEGLPPSPSTAHTDRELENIVFTAGVRFRSMLHGNRLPTLKQKGLI